VSAGRLKKGELGLLFKTVFVKSPIYYSHHVQQQLEKPTLQEYHEFYSSRPIKHGPRRNLQYQPRCVGATTGATTAGGGTAPTQPCGCHSQTVSRIFHISEAIQNIPPEIPEIIYKEYVAIKLREPAVLGWNKVHEDILKLPFCYFMQQIVPTVICMEYPDCHFEGCCYHSWSSVDGRRPLHKVSMNPLMETILLIEISIEYKNFFKICSSDGYDWHEWFLQ